MLFLLLYLYLLVHYIISRHTCLTSRNHCGWLKQRNIGHSTGSLAVHRGRRRGAATGDEVGPHPTNVMFDFLTHPIDPRSLPAHLRRPVGRPAKGTSADEEVALYGMRIAEVFCRASSPRIYRCAGTQGDRSFERHMLTCPNNINCAARVRFPTVPSLCGQRQPKTSSCLGTQVDAQ